jgi:hypothetical protein
MTPSQYNIRRRSDLLAWAVIFVILWALILWGVANASGRLAPFVSQHIAVIDLKVIKPAPHKGKAFYYNLTPREGGQACLVGPWNTLAACRDNLGSALYSHPFQCHISGPAGGNCRNLDSGYGYPQGAGLHPAWQIPDSDCQLIPIIHTHERGKWVRFYYSDTGECTVAIKGKPISVPAGSFTYYAGKQCPGWPWIYIGDTGGPGGDGVCN